MTEHPNFRQIANAGKLSPDEVQLLVHFRAMDDGTRESCLLATEALAKGFPRERPTLMLVHSS